LVPGSCQHVSFNSWNSSIRPDFRAREGRGGRKTVSDVIVVRTRRGRDEVDVVELTAVQLHPLAALLLVLVPAALVDLVLGELVVDIRLEVAERKIFIVD